MSPEAAASGTVHGEQLGFRVRGDVRPHDAPWRGTLHGPPPRRAGGEGVRRTLEIGAGTGANLAYYPDAVEELILAEPFEPMRRRLQRKLADSGDRADARRADRSDSPGGSRSSTVVCTLVL